MLGAAATAVLLAAVTVQGGSTCPTPAAVQARLRPLLPAGTAADNGDVRLEREGQALHVTLHGPDGRLTARRTVGGVHSCEALADAAAVIVAAWRGDVGVRPLLAAEAAPAAADLQATAAPVSAVPAGFRLGPGRGRRARPGGRQPRRGGAADDRQRPAARPPLGRSPGTDLPGRPSESAGGRKASLATLGAGTGAAGPGRGGWIEALGLGDPPVRRGRVDPVQGIGLDDARDSAGLRSWRRGRRTSVARPIRTAPLRRARACAAGPAAWWRTRARRGGRPRSPDWKAC